MRISQARIKGFGPFKDVSIDFDALPESAKLIALCGDNGVGKSTLVDLLVDGAAWRDWPRRPGTKIDHVANDRDSLLEVTHEIGGKRYDVRHLVDGVSGKGESAVYWDGEALTKSGKLTEFYAFAKENFPAKSVVHSSIVSHPAYGSFVTMKATERKDVILLALGVEGIEKLASAARKEIEKASADFSRIGDELSVALNASNVEESASELAHAETRLRIAERRLADARSSLDVARQLAGDSALARQRYEEQVSAFNDLLARTKQAANALDFAKYELAQADAEAAELALGVANGSHDSAKTSLSNAEALASSLRIRRESAQRQLEDRHRVQLELDRLGASKTDIETRIANNRSVLENADKIRAAVTRTAELNDQSLRLFQDAVRIKGELTRFEHEVITCDNARKRHNENAAEAEQRIARVEKTLVERDAVREAASNLDAARNELAERNSDIRLLELDLEALRGQRIAGADERVESLRGYVVTIAECSELAKAHSTAELAIASDNAIVADSVELPKRIAKLEGELEVSRLSAKRIESDVRKIELLAAKLLVVEAAEAEVKRATELRESALSAAEKADGEAAAAQNRAKELVRLRKENVAANEKAAVELKSLEALTAKAPILETAEARIAERTHQLEAIVADIERLTGELEALPEPEPVPADPELASLRVAAEKASMVALDAAQHLAAVKATRAQLEPQIDRLRADAASLAIQLDATPAPVPPEAAPDVARLEDELASVQRTQTEAAQAVGAATARLEAAQAAAGRASALRVELSAAEVELADWTRLAADLGRKGLQAALVDSAGPELTRATNDLLHSCFGTRWTVTYETQRVNGNGGTSEGYDVRIIDTERGHDGVVEDLSDGERTIIGEAASLALTELACKRAGFDNPTLIRDESGAALSPEKRPMWVAMLRRAAQHVNADRVIVISHSEDVQDLCDIKLRVANGNIAMEAS